MERISRISCFIKWMYMFVLILLMVQKSQGQPPCGWCKNVNTGISTANLNWGNLAGFLNIHQPLNEPHISLWGKDEISRKPPWMFLWDFQTNEWPGRLGLLLLLVRTGDDVCWGRSTPYIGDRLIPPFVGNPYNGYINPLLLNWWPSPIIWKQWEFRPDRTCGFVAAFATGKIGSVVNRHTELEQHPPLAFTNKLGIHSWGGLPGVCWNFLGEISRVPRNQQYKKKRYHDCGPHSCEIPWRNLFVCIYKYIYIYYTPRFDIPLVWYEVEGIFFDFLVPWISSLTLSISIAFKKGRKISIYDDEPLIWTKSTLDPWIGFMIIPI